MNAIDHPFGSGRGKNPKSKTVKRNAPRGRRVGLLRPRRTGKKK
jgi:ribosomal protein L2